jgi:hypothetical protein
MRVLDRFRSSHAAAAVAAVVVVASLTRPGPGGVAAAAEPSAADCLDASAASLKLDSLHRLRAERTELLICAALSCPSEIRNECIRRVDDVNAAIPTIMFEVKDAAGNDLGAVKVTMDGEWLTDRLEGIAIAIDPGAHLFTFEAARQAPVRKQLIIREGERRRREVIVLATLASPAPDPRPTLAPVSAPSSGRPSTDGRASPRPARVLPIITTGIGVVGLAVGTAFGLQAMSRRNEARARCPGLCSDQAGVSLWQDAKRAGTVSTIAFAVGAAGLLGGAALWLTGGRESGPAASADVAVGPGSIAVRGRW